VRPDQALSHSGARSSSGDAFEASPQRAIVAFDVLETKVSAGDAGAYATNNDPLELAHVMRGLLDPATIET